MMFFSAAGMAGKLDKQLTNGEHDDDMQTNWW